MFAIDQNLPPMYGQSIGAEICLSSVNMAAAVDMELFRFPFLRLLIFTSYVSLNKPDLVKLEAADKVFRVNNFIFQKREENHRVVAFFVVDKNARKI